MLLNLEGLNCIRWYDGDLKDTVRVGEVRQQAVEGLKCINSCSFFFQKMND